jgi:hypothetical protein
VQASRTVLIHLGLPKTGTTYLQRVLAAHRPALAEQGLLYPGDRQDHFFPAQDALDRPFRGHSDERAPGSWDATVREVNAWPADALISHETFTVATSDQVRKVVDAFPDHSVSIIVTARDVARQLTANWQESVKNGESRTLTEYVAKARSRAADDGARYGFWVWQDLVGVIRRWQEVVQPVHTHVVTVPPSGSGPELLWRRFTEVLGVSLEPDDLAERSANTSLGRVETEFLRRLNDDLGDSISWPDYRSHVKQFLAQRALPRFPQSGPIVLSPEDHRWAAELSRDVAANLQKLELQLHGNVSDLESSETSGDEPTVNDDEVVEVGVRAIAQLLRRIGREQGETAQGRAS